MNKEKFEEKMLSGQITLEEYEKNVIHSDLCLFYDFKLAVSVALESCQEAYQKVFFGKRKLGNDIESIKRILNLMSDPNVGFKLWDRDFVNDFQNLAQYINNTDYLYECLDALKTLYAYSIVRGLTTDEILSKFPEYMYVFTIKDGSPEKYDYWCKFHPNVDMQQLEEMYKNPEIYNKLYNQQYTKEELQQMTPQQLDNIIQYGDPDPFKENEQASMQEELGKSRSLGGHPSSLLIFLLTIGLSASTVMAVWLNSMI